MSKEKLFAQLIRSFEKKEFDQFVKAYLIEIDGIINIISTDGPYDSGLDLRDINFEKIECQYQITIQEKNFEHKLISDIQKANENVKTNNLTNKVKYFYTFPISNTKILEYKSIAKKDYNIILEIYDSSALASISLHFSKLGELILKKSDLDKNIVLPDFFNNQRIKEFYDLMSFGSSNDIKYNIIKSFVLNFLYHTETIEKSKLLGEINKHFQSKIAASYFDDFVDRLSSERKIKKLGGIVELKDEERHRIKEVLDRYKIDETLLNNELYQFLDHHNLGQYLNDIVIKLSEIYESTYSVNLGEFTTRLTNFNTIKDATSNLQTFLRSKILNSEKVESIAKKLIVISDRHAILPRIALGQVYSKVADPDRLQEYIITHNNNKTIFLDANVIINLICADYESDAEYDNFFYLNAKRLLDFVRTNAYNLKTIERYESEAINIFKQALAIIPFSKLSIFTSLGSSDNIFYKFYIHLRDFNKLDDTIESFEDFLKQFKFELKNNDLKYDYKPNMKYLLKSLKISIEDLKFYPDADFKKTINLFKDRGVSSKKNKSPFAQTSDSLMFLRLGDDDVEVNPIDPIFCTWDTSLIPIRKRYFESFPSCTRWLMYTPSRLMDHFSMMNFKVSVGTLSNDVLTILDEDFGFQQKTQSLLDSMLLIINPNDEVGLKYANKLAEMRDLEIIQIENKPENLPESTPETASVDKVFQKLFINYMSSKDGHNMEDLKKVFTYKDYFDDILEIISFEAEQVNITGSTSEDFINKMNAIITDSLE